MLALAREIRAARPAAGLVIFTYLNPILRYGLRKFADDAKAAGVDGVLATDMIVEEAGDIWPRWTAWALRRFFSPRPPVPMSGSRPSPRTPKVLSTPFRASALPARSRVWPRMQPRWSPAFGDGRKLPVAVGFGISNAEHFAQVAEFADAAVIGSAIVEVMERLDMPETAPGAVARFIKGLHLPQAALAR